MFKPQMKFQKILFVALIVMSAFIFLYAIGLCTDLYPLYLSRAIKSKAVPGNEFYDEIQPYNSELVKFAIITIIASVLPFIFSSNKRRKYYIDNLISSVIHVGTYIACSIYLIMGTMIYKARYLEIVDIEYYKEYCEKKKYFFSGTTIWFDLGYVAAGLLIVGSLLIIGNYIWKMIIVKKENDLINKGGK